MYIYIFIYFYLCVYKISSAYRRRFRSLCINLLHAFFVCLSAYTPEQSFLLLLMLACSCSK